jgi:hypothetical protein
MKIVSKDIANNWWFKWLLVGIVIRLVLMPITLHPDLWGQSIASYFFSHKGVINVYEHIRNLSQEHPLVRNFSIEYLFIYPPLTYFTQGFLNLLARPFLNPQFFPSLMQAPGEILQFAGVRTQIFLLKVPYLFVDILTAFVLANLFSQHRKKKLAFALWMINPLSLYATFMMGQNDILPVLFSVLSVYFLTQKRYKLSLLSLGIGGSFKLYPLLFIFPVAFSMSSKLVDKVKGCIMGFLPYIATTFPFLPSVAYRQMVLLNPESRKMLFMGWPVTAAEFIYPFVLMLLFIYFHAYYSSQKKSIIKYFLTILLLIFSVTHYHPQWFLWITPFLIWELVETNFRKLALVLVLLVSWAVTTLFFEPSLSYGLFTPIYPELKEAVGLSEIVSQFTDVFQVKSLVRSVFAGASLYYALNLFKVTQAKE